MAKAHITTQSGTKITIEGNPQEVAAVVKQIEGKAATPAQSVRAKTRTARPIARQRATPSNLIASLIDGGFFKKPKDLAAVKVALAEMGHLYPVTTLSPILLRLVRKRELRRIKEKKKWLYTG